MKIGIIGAGKVGIAIANTLQRKGLDVVVVSDITGVHALNRARQYLGDTVHYTDSNMEIIERSDIIAVTTRDSAISDVAHEISGKATRLDGKLFFHTSGAHPSSILKPLDEKGAIIGSLHPLQTFPDIDSAIRVLPNTYIFIEGDERARTTLEFMAKNIGHAVIFIEGKDKVYYHLCAVFVCNLLCALLYSGEEIMKKIDIKLEPFFPIINATLQNIQSKGCLDSLTGPIVRGDVGTMVEHLGAMRDMKSHQRIYRALSLTALDMVRERKTCSREILDTIERILEATDEE